MDATDCVPGNNIPIRRRSGTDDVVRGVLEKDAVARIEAVISKTGLAISEIAAQRSGQLLAVHPAYDETMDILASPEVRGRPAARQAQAEQDLRRAIARAAILVAHKVVAFSGGLACPFFYPYPYYYGPSVSFGFGFGGGHWGGGRGFHGGGWRHR